MSYACLHSLSPRDISPYLFLDASEWHSYWTNRTQMPPSSVRWKLDFWRERGQPLSSLTPAWIICMITMLSQLVVMPASLQLKAGFFFSGTWSLEKLTMGFHHTVPQENP